MKPHSAIVITTPHRTSKARIGGFHERWEATQASKELPLTVFMGKVLSSPVNGCFRSHRDALLTANEPVLMLEEDATFAPEFTLDVDYPDDASLFYFGGEHLLPTEPYSDGIVLCRKIRRNHGYVVYDPQQVARGLGEPRGHIDKALTEMHLRTYAVSPFTIGQAAGPSLINIKPRAVDAFWNDSPNERSHPQT